MNRNKSAAFSAGRFVLSAFLFFAFFGFGPAALFAEPAPDAPPPAQKEKSAPAVPAAAGPSQTGRGDPVQTSVPLVHPETHEGPRYALVPSSLRPGEPVTAAFADFFTGPGSREFEAVLVDSAGKRLAKARFFNFANDPAGREVKAAILAVPSTAAPGPMLVRIEAPGRVVQDLPLVVENRDFAAEIIPLDNRNTEIRTAPDPRKTSESEQLWAILSRTGSDIYAAGAFVPPVTSTRRTSFFGDRRVYRYVNGSTDTAVHAGVDYGIPAGTEVRSCAPGKVVFARPRIVTGNSVIIEHFPGVYSLYYHLEKIEAAEGLVVPAGTLLGFSGSTGLSTGPHLHWEIRVSGENTDPDAFVARPVLDKNEILSRLIKY